MGRILVLKTGWLLCLVNKTLHLLDEKKTFLFFQFLPYSERYSLRRAADDHRALRAAANLKGQRGRAAGSSPLSPTAGSSARLTQERKTQSDLC